MGPLSVVEATMRYPWYLVTGEHPESNLRTVAPEVEHLFRKCRGLKHNCTVCSRKRREARNRRHDKLNGATAHHQQKLSAQHSTSQGQAPPGGTNAQHHGAPRHEHKKTKIVTHAARRDIHADVPPLHAVFFSGQSLAKWVRFLQYLQRTLSSPPFAKIASARSHSISRCPGFPHS